MNVYWKEMRSGLKPLIFWSLGFMLFIAASMQKFSVFSVDPASLNILNQLPPALRDMFGVGYLDFTKVSGFYGMIYPYLLLMAAVHASMLGAVIVSKEERDKTSEFLYVKPASRQGILTAKALASVTTVILLNLVTWAASAALIGTYGGGEDMGKALTALMAGLFLIQLLFTALGIASAAVMARPTAATGIVTGVMLAMYLLSVAIDVSGKLNALKALTPFQYFDARRIVGRGEGLKTWGILICLIVTAALAGASCLRFTKRDLKMQRRDAVYVIHFYAAHNRGHAERGGSRKAEGILRQFATNLMSITFYSCCRLCECNGKCGADVKFPQAL